MNIEDQIIFNELLTETCAKFAPIHGVSVGIWSDPSSWRIDFKDEATAEQRAAAEKAKLAFEL